MTYQLNDKHFRSVASLPAQKRYDYFVKRVADWQKAWTLQGERGWLTATDDDGITHLPLWAHPLFAEMCKIDEWATAKVVDIDVHDLVGSVLPQLEGERQMVSVMPTSSSSGVSVAPQRLRNDLQFELEKIE